MPRYRVMRGTLVTAAGPVGPGGEVELPAAEGDALCAPPVVQLARLPDPQRRTSKGARAPARARGSKTSRG